MRSMVAALAMCLSFSPALAAAAESTPAPASGQSETERNRAVVTDFMNMFYTQKKVRDAFEKHVVADYIQHNPGAPDGREGTLKVLEPFLSTQPQLSFKIHRILVDGDMAAVHSEIIVSAGQPSFAVVDILRLKDGKVVEHWDVMQPVPEKSANPHPMF